MWTPGVRRLHMAGESWLIQANRDECLEKLLEGVETITEEEHLEIHKVDREKYYVEIFSFTPGCNWLDVVEVTFRAGDLPDTTIGEVVSFSSGLFPACIPFSFLCNICCFCAPFSGNGFNTRRVEAIRKCIHLDLTVTAETKCNCCPS